AAGRMVRAQSITATLVYTYNHSGLRVAQSVDGDPTSFSWDWALPLAQVMTTSDGVLSLYGLGRIGEVQGGEWAYQLSDALSSVRQWSDGNGAVTYAGGYTPFGVEMWREGNTTSAWGYTGEWQDLNLGMLYLRARWYQSAVGRFTRKDPWSGNVRQPATINPYIYGLNNPALCTDPSGKWCIAGFDVGPGRGCTDSQRKQWAAFWNTTAGFVSSPAFAEGFLLEFADSVLAGGISIPSFVFEHWLNHTNNYQLLQFFTQFMLLSCSSGPESYEALRAPYSYLFNRPDPYFQLGRAVGRVTALGLALGEIGISVSGGTASVAIAGTGIGVPLGAGGLVVSAEIGAHAAAVIGVVVVKEMADHLVMSVVRGGLPSGGGGMGDGGGASNANRPDYSGPPEGWENTRPEDLDPRQGKKLQDALADRDYRPSSNLVTSDPRLKDTAKFNYVIDSKGNILVSRTGHHPDMVNGQNVYGAGEMFINQSGEFVWINSRSGHYLPDGASFFPYLENLMQDLGIRVAPGTISSSFP
ncbi:MAG TPA: RHS repeat-associated core domain-containing protein, partial [Chloroflexi bacterium]|nr:RHS repeat-associated core domain-containing protein [Chloroflexota bacterium]